MTIRRSFILLIPLVFIGFFAEMLLFFPWNAYQGWLSMHQQSFYYQLLHILDSVCLDYFSLLFAFMMGTLYADEKHLAKIHCVVLGLLCAICFLILVNYGTPVFNERYMTAIGVLISILAALLCCPFYVRSVLRKGRNPSRHVGPFLDAVIIALPPFLIIMTVCLLLAAGCRHLGVEGDNLQGVCNGAFLWLFAQHQGNELLGAVIFHVSVQLLGFIGLNGNNVLSQINSDYYDGLLQANIAAVGQGLTPPHIITQGFNNVYVLMGGSGCVLAILITLLVTGKNQADRTIAKLSILPSCFNISEVITFGIPVVYNPFLLIPFVCVPVINVVIAYTLTAVGLVPVISQRVLWTLPPIFNGWQASHSLRVCILQVALLGIDCVVYYPFLCRHAHAQRLSFRSQVRNLELLFKQHEENPLAHQYVNYLQKNDFIAHTLMEDLRQDLQHYKLFLVYQPQYDCFDNFVGAEAVIRWNHELAGAIYPPLIVALAREGGFLSALETFIFQETCLMIKQLEEACGRNVKISANVTGVSMNEPHFEEMVEEAVRSAGITKSDLWIEVTEQDALANTKVLEFLKAQGHRLMIDDFGMGHTSITYLESNLFDVIKLDGSLTRTILENHRSKEIVSSIIELSRLLHLQVIAEYVENVAQKRELAAMGCDVFQGFLYSKPVSGKKLLELAVQGHLDIEKNA